MLFFNIVIASVLPSVCPLCYLLLNHCTKFNQIWCVSDSHEWGAQRQIFLAPPPEEGSKGQISFNFSYNVNFKDFFYTKLCVCSQMKDTKHIRRDFYSVPGLGLWGAGGAQGVKKYFLRTWSCGISNRRG